MTDKPSSINDVSPYMKSGLTSFLNEDNEAENENDLYLQAPDKYNPYQSHLLVSIKFYIGGKSPVFLGPIDLSKQFLVKDVIGYILTLYRNNKTVKQQVELEHADQPDCYELRHIDDDLSDSDEDQEYYKPNWELPPL